ncbi:MAG: hypothetical protein VYB54_06810 [Pseudomonadota bacterium]|nr:hypothetical protein [Pseudomonadota bacterium]
MNQLEEDTTAAAESPAAHFARHDYVLVRGLLDAPLVDFLRSYVDTKFASKLFGIVDAPAVRAAGHYGDQMFDGLLEFVRPALERQSGLSLLPTYSYVRIYRHGDRLLRHTDRHACEISVSLSIAQTPAEPWPLFVTGRTGTVGAELMPGDAVMYRGFACKHWRETYPGRRQVQVFLHYVDKRGPHAGEKYDRRVSLMRPPVPGRDHGLPADTAAADGTDPS